MKFHGWPFFLCACTLVACDLQQDNPLSSPTEYYDQGVRYFHEGSNRQAEESFGKAVALLPQSADFINISELYGYMGRTELKLGEYQAALENLGDAKQRSAVLNDYRLEAQICSWKGDALFEMRRYADAINSYRESMRLSSALDDITTRAQTGLRMCSVMIAAGMLDQASNQCGESLAVLQRAGKNTSVAEALGDMGDIYRRQGRFPEALNSISQALETLGSSGDPLLQAKLKIALGLVHRAQSDPNAAIGEFRDAVNVLRIHQTERDYEGLSLFYLGTIYEENGRLNDARRYYSDALEIDRALGDKIAENYLYLFVIRCNLELMSDVQRNQVTDKLLQSYQQIAAKFHECGHETGEAYVYTLIGSLFESQGNLGGARSMFQKAVNLDLENRGEYFDADLQKPFLEELGLVDNHSEWYDKLAFVLLKMNLKYDAIAVMDLSQTRSSVDKFKYLRVAVRHVQLKDVVKDCRSKLGSIETLQMELANSLSGKQKSVDSRRMSALQSQLTDLWKNVHDETARIAGIHPNYVPLLCPTIQKSQDLQKLIPDGAVVLDFLPSEHELDLFAMTRERLDVRSVAIGKDSLLALVHQYEQLLQDPSVYAGAGGLASLTSMTSFARLIHCSTGVSSSSLEANSEIFHSKLLNARTTGAT